MHLNDQLEMYWFSLYITFSIFSEYMYLFSISYEKLFDGPITTFYAVMLCF